MNICMFGYYNLADGYLAAAQSIRYKGYNLTFYPYMRDVNEKWGPKKREESQGEALKGIDILLWWLQPNHIRIKDTENIRAKFPNLKQICYNWDPSYIDVDYFRDSRMKTFEIIKRLDKYVTCNPYESKMMKVDYYPAGFNKDISFPREMEKDIDISFILTNLYTDFKVFPEAMQVIQRKKLLDAIIKEKNINLHIYGFNHLKGNFPKHYQRQVSYTESQEIFNRSKINISLSAVAIDGYFSERTGQIIGCGGVVLTNAKLENGFIPDVDYIYCTSLEEAMNKIHHYLKNPHLLDEMRERVKAKRGLLEWDGIVKFFN